jgi:hypothetical protein
MRVPYRLNQQFIRMKYTFLILKVLVLLLFALLLVNINTFSQRMMYFYRDGNISQSIFVSDIDSIKFVEVPDLKNSQIRVKQDISRGGAISYISVSGSSRNLVNIADEGRYIQQSYYAGRSLDRRSEGQSPAWSPWAWNPIQAGDYARNRAKILTTSKTDTSTYVSCIPMLWDMDNEPAEAVMEQWTSIDGNVISVRCRLTCSRTDYIYGEDIACDQEIPAVYLISALDNLYSYLGDAPFSGAAVTSTDIVQLESGFWGVYNGAENPFPAEKWMAFVDGSGFGVGVYSPDATKFLAGRAGGAGDEEWGWSTNYIAPVCVRGLMKNSVFEYRYFLAVGSLENIRSAFYKIAAGL